MRDDTLRALKDARNKCARTVDESTLKELDKAISDLESKPCEKCPQKWLSTALGILSLIRFLAGLDIE